MNPAALLLGIAVLAVAAGAAIYASRKTYLTPADRVFLIGDSIGVGLLPRLAEQLGQLGYVVAGNPVGGTTIRSWSGRADLVSAPQGWGATVVIVVLGTNDSAEYPNLSGVADQSAKLTSRLRGGGMRVVWLSPATVPKFYRGSLEVHQSLMQGAQPQGATVIDARRVPITKIDGVHPGPKGYSDLAAFIVERLTR